MLDKDDETKMGTGKRRGHRASLVQTDWKSGLLAPGKDVLSTSQSWEDKSKVLVEASSHRLPRPSIQVSC